MNPLYSLAQPFVWQPLRAFGVAAGLLLLHLLSGGAGRHSTRALAVAAAAWALFGLLEAQAKRERADIRVDLLVTWPALCLTTVVCLVLAARSWMRR